MALTEETFVHVEWTDVEVGTTRVRRHSRGRIGVWLAAGWMALIGFLAISSLFLPFQDPSALNRNQARKLPSWDHWLGTDNLSRDILSRIANGARVSLLVGVVSALLASIVGVGLGLLAGYFRRTTSSLIMGAMDVLLAAPALILVITLTTFLGPGVRNLIIVIALLAVPAFARVTRTQTVSFAERDFVKAAKVLGATRKRIILKEIAPNILPTIAAYFLVTVSLAILIEGALSFLNLGVSRERPTWGGMINDGRSHLGETVHISLIPALVMFLTVLSLNTLGERLLRYHRRLGDTAA
jgi:peptide/nickel transport system permease protein